MERCRQDGRTPHDGGNVIRRKVLCSSPNALFDQSPVDMMYDVEESPATNGFFFCPHLALARIRAVPKLRISLIAKTTFLDLPQSP